MNLNGLPGSMMNIFTTNSEGRTLLWQVEGAKAEHELVLERNAKPVLSPSKQQMAVPTTQGMQIYDARSGDLLATVGSGDLSYASLAFSPSGRQLAEVSVGHIDVIDVTTSEITRSFPCKDANRSKASWWVDEEYLLASNSLLVHVPRRIIA